MKLLSNGATKQKRKWLTSLLLSLGATGLFGLTLPAAPAEAVEWYVGGFTGGAFFPDDDMKFTGTSTPPPSTVVNSAKDVSIDSSSVAGAKAGACVSFPWLCIELEFDHFTPKIGLQHINGSTTFIPGGTTTGFVEVEPIDLSVWNLGLNFIARTGFMPAAGFPLGNQLHLYGGVGPTFVWTEAKDKACTVGIPVRGGTSGCGQTDTDFSVGIAAPVGAKFFLTKNLALFGEYKFKHWTSDFDFSNSAGGTTRTASADNVTFNANLFYVGLALHWN